MASKPKPIFCVTHPRACSTAFERVFMTRKDLACVHEPFGDAFYYGPERMSIRYEHDEAARKESGFQNSTYATIFERLDREESDGKRVFIKDIIHYLLPPDAKPPQIAPSLMLKKRGIGTNDAGHSRTTSTGSDVSLKPFPYGTRAEPGNPTVIPSELLRKFHYTFLIRDPHYSIPSYYRCTIPPLDKVTGFYQFYPSEAGYDEVRRVFDYLVSTGLVGPVFAGDSGINSDSDGGESNSGDSNSSSARNKPMADICIVDADDMLDNPYEMIEAYCQTVGLDFSPDMLHWEDEDNQTRAKDAFEKWRGFHEDAIESTELRPRVHKRAKTEDEFDREWTQKYGLKGANIIRETVDANMDTYLYLKQFALKVAPRHRSYDPRDE